MVNDGAHGSKFRSIGDVLFSSAWPVGVGLWTRPTLLRSPPVLDAMRRRFGTIWPKPSERLSFFRLIEGARSRKHPRRLLSLRPLSLACGLRRPGGQPMVKPSDPTPSTRPSILSPATTGPTPEGVPV